MEVLAVAVGDPKAVFLVLVVQEIRHIEALHKETLEVQQVDQQIPMVVAVVVGLVQ